MIRRLIALAVVGMCLGLAGTSFAAEAGKKSGDIKVKDLGTDEIVGKIYKPTVFYVLARSDFAYKGLEIPHSFVERIVKEATRSPF